MTIKLKLNYLGDTKLEFPNVPRWFCTKYSDYIQIGILLNDQDVDKINEKQEECYYEVIPMNGGYGV